jgi:DAK2 domain fusion protein YloV
MPVTKISGALLKKMVTNGAVNLKNCYAEVDALNVFPVPDGDTGTNMSMTVTSGIRELENCEASSIIEEAKVLSRGCLMGARGNSGVILSQFFRGLYVGIKQLDHNYLNVQDLMACLESGCKIAYKAVMEPVEGTILTVVRESAEYARSKVNECKTIDELLDVYLGKAKESLANTPNLLPVLKEAGVVDSGGAGFVKIVEGMVMAIKGEILEADDAQPKSEPVEEVNPQDLKYFYSMDIELELKKPEQFEIKEYKAALSLVGENLEVTEEGTLVKTHINTNRPGRILDIAQKQGEFNIINVENLRYTALKAQEPEQKAEISPRKQFALIAVCFGDGISQTFKELGVDYVIEGGQTMNPSTEAFVEALKAVNAENVIIIPNNSNVIMAANQAKNLVSGCNVEVLKAKTIAQGYVSLVNYNPEASLEENYEAMSEQIANVTSGEITYSVRDTEIGGVKIQSGDYMGISNGEILVSVKDKSDCLHDLLEKIIKDESEIVTVFVGADVTQEEKDTIEDLCLSFNSDIDVEIVDGKQEIYSYIIAVE